MIFVKYRKDIDELQETVILTYVKDVFKNVFNTYTTDDILSKRQEFDAEVTKLLSDEMMKEGFEVGQLTFGMRYPNSINKAIELKTAAMQVAQQKETELRVAKANADILITNAKAEAEANKLRQQTLNTLLIQQQFIEKWDGKTAIYGNAPSFFKSVN
jgi:regulator of protease activity HflC (stomatin/prohibitin superfamily)